MKVYVNKAQYSAIQSELNLLENMHIPVFPFEFQVKNISVDTDNLNEEQRNILRSVKSLKKK